MTALRLPARWTHAVLAISLVLAAPAARADEGEDARAKAIRLSKEGGAAYREGRYGEALQRFEEAYRAFPAPPLLLNLSRAQLKLGDCDEALRYAQVYLSASPAGDTSPESPDAWLSTVNTECPEITVTSEPPGATLSIEGSRQNAVPTTPWKGRLSTGTHVLRARLAGFTDATATVRVIEGQPLQASITFSAAQQQITIASKSMNLSPPPSEVHATPATARPFSPLRKAGLAATVVGGAALVAAVVLGVSSGAGLTNLHTANSARSGSQAQQQINTVSGEALGANVLYVAGGVLAAGGVALAVAF